MDISLFQQAIASLPSAYQERVLGMAETLSPDDLSAFANDLVALTDKWRDDEKKQSESLEHLETMIIQAEHAAHTLERHDKNEEERKEHEHDIEAAESLMTKSDQ